METTYKKITSLQNPLIKKFLKLINDTNYRYSNKTTIIYGEHLLEEAESCNLILKILVNENYLDIFLKKFKNITNDKIIITNDKINKYFEKYDVKNNIIAMIKFNYFDNITYLKNDIFYQDIVMLDNIQDPGNLGSILRTCVAFSVKNIIISQHSVDPFGLKVLRASQGIQFKLNIIILDNLLSFCEIYKGQIIATKIDIKNDIFAISYSRPTLWIFGNEGAGVSIDLEKHADILAKIPLCDNVQSLNVGVASAVCIYEMYRWRLLS